MANHHRAIAESIAMAFLKNPRNLNAQTVQFRQIVAALAFWSRSLALAQRVARSLAPTSPAVFVRLEAQSTLHVFVFADR